MFEFYATKKAQDAKLEVFNNPVKDGQLVTHAPIREYTAVESSRGLHKGETLESARAKVVEKALKNPEEAPQAMSILKESNETKMVREPSGRVLFNKITKGIREATTDISEATAGYIHALGTRLGIDTSRLITASGE